MRRPASRPGADPQGVRAGDQADRVHSQPAQHDVEYRGIGGGMSDGPRWLPGWPVQAGDQRRRAGALVDRGDRFRCGPGGGGDGAQQVRGCVPQPDQGHGLGGGQPFNLPPGFDKFSKK